MSNVLKNIELPSSRAVVTLFDHTAHQLGFSAYFCEKGRLVPVVEIGESPAEALRKLRQNPMVRKSRVAEWRRH